MRAARRPLEPSAAWIVGALDLVRSFGHVQSAGDLERSPAAILVAARAHLRALLPFRATAFLLPAEEGPGLVLADCEPEDDGDWLRAEADEAAASGDLAWAVRSNRPVVVDARSGGGRLVLHTLQAGARSLGVFVGVLAEGEDAPDEAAANLLSLILLVTAQALLSAEIHRGLERKVTERTRALEEANDELRRLQAEAARTAKMEAIGRLAAGVAHDFNNLLQVIQTHSELMLRRLPGGDALARPAEAIRDAATRASDLTRRLLVFGKAQPLQPRPIDLNALVAGVAALLRRLIGEHIELATECQPEPGVVEADPAQLERVIVNLAVNARDAMPRGGRLALSTAAVDLGEERARALGVAPGPYVALTVSDTGCGMDAATRERAFEPFFTTRGEGTGLGLATVYGIVRQSGGAVTLDSEPGRGTCVAIYLPRHARGAAAAATVDAPMSRALADAEGAAGPRGRTILLAEDEDVVRTLVREVLETHGYTVIEARDGTEALGLGHARREPIDLLLTDLVMPGLGGEALAQRLAAERPEMAVLYMTGYAVGEPAPPRPDTGPVWLRKPFTTAGLTRKVREALEAARAGRRPDTATGA